MLRERCGRLPARWRRGRQGAPDDLAAGGRAGSSPSRWRGGRRDGDRGRSRRRGRGRAGGAILDQAALFRAVGGDLVMRAQLEHLARQAERPHITVQVIPFFAGAHPGMPGSFIVLKFAAGNPDVIHIDSMAGDLFLEEETDIQRYNDMCQHLRAMALSPADTAALLASLQRDHWREES
ncbi:DUF5753 domain-containing protein [Streptosporangium sp. DT93]|uniref:DUF5753 domain-containing protein n=1 Tax=Streptosporangium sp. DT93 TaxID=3393428 RepID=UPI003CE793EB